jgi:hypothetical protein
MNKLRYKIDLVLSAGKGTQILWLGIIVSFLFGIFYAINALLDEPLSLFSLLALVLSPGEFREEGHLTFQVIVNLIGLVVVSSMLISLLSNMVENRVDDFTRGIVRYKFKDHLLFLGADDMLKDTIEGQFNTDEHLPKAIVVLTSQDAAEIRKRLLVAITDKAIRKRLIVLYGDRAQREQLISVWAQTARRVYILGEPNEQDHDTKNTLCLRELKSLSTAMECYMVCDHLSTLRIMQLQTEPLPPMFHLTVTNALESWAQRVLVNQDGFPKLYRKEFISPDDDEYVHLVLVGATQMAYALAITAAHIAHYPNFLTKQRRTRISLIDANIEPHRDFLRSHYESLFRLSRQHYMWLEQTGAKRTLHSDDYTPAPEFDFLDIEWDFISADVESPEVRNLLAQWSKDKQQMLTIAYCMPDMKANLATALYAPDDVMTENIPLLIYQPTNDALAEWTKEFTRYKNLFPFGMRQDCYDKTFRRRLRWAMEANEAYEDNAAKLNPQRKRKNWHDLKLTLQFSNMYCANYCYAVLRHTDKQYYAHLEHQRWMAERLLLGYKAMNKADRIRIEHTPEPERQRLMDECDPYFMHPNIQPFEELTANSVHKDEVMTECLSNKMQNL